MALRKAFKKTLAATALATTLAYSAAPALAQDNTPPSNTPATQTTLQVSKTAIETNPLVPMELIYGLGGLALLTAGFAASKRSRGWTLRAAFGAAGVAILLNPQIITEQRDQLPTEVRVVVDHSASQNIGDRTNVTAEMQAKVLEQLKNMKGVNVKVIDAGNGKQGEAKDGTMLFGDLDKALSEVPPERLGAVIMMTDGQVHDTPDKPPALMGKAPLHVMVSGQEGERDRRIVLEKSPLFGVVNEDIVFKFRVEDNGVAPGSEGAVKVNISADGKVVDTRNVTPGETVEVKMKVPHGGPNLIEFQTEAMAGELTDTNNVAVAQVKGVRDKLRVLLVSGQPTAAERTWRNLLKSDPSVDLIHFTILRGPTKFDSTPTDELALIEFPTRELFMQKLKNFDLVVLDRFQQDGLMPSIYFDFISEYVKNGGALMVTTGPEYSNITSIYNTPLAQILPAAPSGLVNQKRFHPDVTKMGERHPVTRDLGGDKFKDSKWGDWFRQIGVDSTKGTVLMKGASDQPLMVLNREGKGRVVMLMSDNLGLWSRGFDGGGPVSELIRRSVHWSMKEYGLEEEQLRMTSKDGKLTVERQTMADTVAPVKLRSPSGEIINVELKPDKPGIFKATIDAPELGLYRAEQGGKFAFTNVGTANPKEFADPRSTVDVLKPVVTQSGGSITRMASTSGSLNVPDIRERSSDSAMAGNGWMGIRMTDASVLKSSDRWSLLPGIIGLTLLLGFAAAAWHREGEGKMPRLGFGRKKEGGAPPPPKPDNTPKP